MLAFQPGAAGGDQHVFRVGAGVVAAIHARLCIQQVEEVVKVGDLSLGQSLGNAQLGQLIQLHPVKPFIVRTVNPQASASSIASVVGVPVYHIARTALSAASSHREPLHIDKLMVG